MTFSRHVWAIRFIKLVQCGSVGLGSGLVIRALGSSLGVNYLYLFGSLAALVGLAGAWLVLR